MEKLSRLSIRRWCSGRWREILFILRQGKEKRPRPAPRRQSAAWRETEAPRPQRRPRMIQTLGSVVVESHTWSLHNSPAYFPSLPPTRQPTLRPLCPVALLVSCYMSFNKLTIDVIDTLHGLRNTVQYELMIFNFFFTPLSLSLSFFFFLTAIAYINEEAWIFFCFTAVVVISSFKNAAGRHWNMLVSSAWAHHPPGC